MRFLRNVKKYWKYLIYSTKAKLKAEVADSYLSWLWWVLDPLLFMGIYTFVAIVVFERTLPYISIFVITGLSLWTFFNKNLIQSVKLLRGNKRIITKIYIPKYILLLQNMMINGFKMLISLALVFIMMLLFKAPFTWYIVYAIPNILMLIVVTFGFSTVLMHCGVFISDLSNIVTVGLKLVFYLSGVFYDVSARLPAPYNSWLVKGNPAALAMQGCRNAFLYHTAPNWKYLAIWTVIGFAVGCVGVHTIHRYENSYGKVL